MLMDTHLSLFTIQLLALLSFIPKFPAGATSITRNPVYACEGENITVSCVLTVPNDGDIFTSIEISFIIGETNIPISKLTLDTVNIVNSFNLSRFVADAPLGNSTYLTGSITLLSYDSSTDKNFRMGCVGSLRRTGASMTESFIRTNRLLYSDPPSAPSLQSSVSNFNTATCSADISLSWTPPPSNRTVDRYFLYLDGSPLPNSNKSYNHSTNLNINTDYQYSVTAMNCAGNSTTSSSNVNSVASYSLLRSSQYVCLAYNNVTGRLTVNWGLNTPTQPSGVSGLDISYSLQLFYSHSRKNVTYRYANRTSFTLPSSQLSYNTTLITHNFTQLVDVETNITANLTIVRQCRQSFIGTPMECFLRINNLLIPPTSTPKTVSTTTSTLAATTTSSNATTTTTPTNGSDTPSNLPIIIGSAAGASAFLFILPALIIMFVLLFIFLRKKKEKIKHTGLDGSDVKKYDELEDTYSKVNKKNKVELTYLEIDHSSGTGKIVRPPTIPPTNYVDIADFPKETLPETTQYVSLQN